MSKIISIGIAARVDGTDVPCTSVRTYTPANGVPKMSISVPTLSTKSGVVQIVSLTGEARSLQSWQEGSLSDRPMEAQVTITVDGKSVIMSGYVSSLRVTVSAAGSQVCEMEIVHKMSMLGRATLAGISPSPGSNWMAGKTKPEQQLLNQLMDKTIQAGTEEVKKINTWDMFKKFMEAVRVVLDARVKNKLVSVSDTYRLSQLEYVQSVVDSFESEAKVDLSTLQLADIPYLVNVGGSAMSKTGLFTLVSQCLRSSSVSSFLWETLASQLLHVVRATPDWSKGVCHFYDPTGTYQSSKITYDIPSHLPVQVSTSCSNPATARASCVYFYTYVSSNFNNGKTTGASIKENLESIYATYPDPPTSGRPVGKPAPIWISSTLNVPATIAQPGSTRQANTDARVREVLKQQATSFAAARKKQGKVKQERAQSSAELVKNVQDALLLVAKDTYEQQAIDSYNAAIVVESVQDIPNLPLAQRVTFQAKDGKLCEGYVEAVRLDVSIDNSRVNATTTFDLTHVLFS